MNSSLFIGATGMKGLSQGMSVISNNLANVSTYGFKQQNIQYSDLIYSAQGNLGSGLETQEDSLVTSGELGHGMTVDSIRTFFTQGDMEGTKSVSDLALSGKGFFQVTDDAGGVYYTRTGDFITDKQGYMRTPAGMHLTGYRYNEDGTPGDAGPIQLDRATQPARATSSLSLGANLGFSEDLSTDDANPYFGLLSKYDALSTPPLGKDDAGFSQTVSIYDADGNKKDVTIYFDGAPSASNQRQMEFLVALPQDGEQAAQSGDGLLMSGVLTFDATGRLTGVAAFTPSVAGSKDLTQWTAAASTGKGFLCDIDGQQVGIDFGFESASAATGGASTAAGVGTDAALLGGLTDGVASGFATTAFSGVSTLETVSQDGYAEGQMSFYDIAQNGDIIAYYSNGQNQKLWQIPVCRFTSEDGLYREGGNLYSATEASGVMEMGVAGTENYGAINAYNLETSNVDMTTEMVNMITTQRGFQSNSKVITTADEMLRKAMEIKRT